MKRLKYVLFYLGLCLAFFQVKAQNRGVPVQIKGESGQTLFSYEASYALLIGNSDYSDGWDDLNGVKTDLAEVKRVLEAQGFTIIEKQNLTGEGIRSALSDFQVEYNSKASRMLVWFAGHGHSLKLSYGDADNYMGYIVGTDAPNPVQDEALFKKGSVPMGAIKVFLEQTDKPRHILFLFDSCFAGSIFDVRANDGEPPFIEDATSRVVRQIITSGSRGQKVPDVSIFRKYFVLGLQDRKADANNDGYITGVELGMYLKTNVINVSNKTQTPQYGTVKDPDLSQGDFVFKVGTSRPLVRPPSNTEDGLSVIEAQAQAETTEQENRRQWQAYQSRMGNAFSRMETVDAGSGRAATKQEGWGIFLRDYASDNPYSSEDETLRQKAQTRRDYWAAYKAAPVLEGISLPDVVKVGERLTYGATVSGEGLTFRWEMGDGKTLSGASVSHIYTKAGRYTLRLTVENSGGKRTEERQVIVQAAISTPILTNMTIPGVIKAGDRLTYSVSVNGEGVEVLWDMGDGYTGKGLSIAHTYTRSGSYTIVVTLVNGGGSVTERRSVLVGSADLPRLWTNSIGMKFVLVGKGSFMMGSPDSDKEASSDEKPQHRVNITKDFYVGQYEVTQGEWEAVMGSNPSHFKGANRPVESVSWEDAQAFIQKLNEREGTGSYRLLTEAEWEYSARAGSSTKYSFGDDPSQLCQYGNVADEKAKETNSSWTVASCNDGVGAETAAVGRYRPNAWGLSDMHGNVWEWVQDWYQGDYYKNSPSSDPLNLTKNSNTYRVLRGGSWGILPQYLRAARRGSRNPSFRYDLVGFRLAKTL